MIALLLFPAGCTVYHGGVKDVDSHIKDGKAHGTLGPSNLLTGTPNGSTLSNT